MRDDNASCRLHSRPVCTRLPITSSLVWIRVGGERKGVSTGPVGHWNYPHRTGLRISSVLVALVFVFWSQPPALVAIIIVILLLVVLGLIELIGRPPSRPPAAGLASGG